MKRDSNRSACWVTGLYSELLLKVTNLCFFNPLIKRICIGGVIISWELNLYKRSREKKPGTSKTNSGGLKWELVSPVMVYGVWMACISWLSSHTCFAGSRWAAAFGNSRDIPDLSEALPDPSVLTDYQQAFNTERLNTYKSSTMFWSCTAMCRYVGNLMMQYRGN